MGLGNEILPCVHRATAVRKAATAGRGNRPSPDEHLASLEVDSRLAAAQHITIVDDVITQGATMIAVGAHLRAAFPTAVIRAFALVRTMSRLEDLESMIAPCVGRVTLSRLGYVSREP